MRLYESIILSTGRYSAEPWPLTAALPKTINDCIKGNFYYMKRYVKFTSDLKFQHTVITYLPTKNAVSLLTNNVIMRYTLKFKMLKCTLKLSDP